MGTLAFVKPVPRVPVAKAVSTNYRKWDIEKEPPEPVLRSGGERVEYVYEERNSATIEESRRGRNVFLCVRVQPLET